MTASTEQEQDVLAGLEQETFAILPHPQVLGYMRKKTENYDRWISGMAKIQAQDAGSVREVTEHLLRHSGAMQSIEPGISRFRVWSCGPSRNDGES
nr:hypothetical protein [Bradyrhizobium sp. JYMT SZCCT0180]